MNYGIELEFFVLDNRTELIVPAYKATNNLDGNPVVGEIKTGIFDNIIDCVFDLEKKLFIEKTTLENKGFQLSLIPQTKVDNNFLINLRKDTKYINNKNLEVLEEKSIYNKSIGKLLPRGVYKASLQVNISNNSDVSYFEYEKITVEDKYKYDKKRVTKSYSDVFDYITIINKLDKAFLPEIKATSRVAGVYAIKSGELGKRIEYRSLPNNINLVKLITTLK